MNFHDIKNDLEKFEIYKKKILLIEEAKNYQLFYLIIFNGEILRFNSIKIESNELKSNFIESKKYIDFSCYVKRELHSKYIEENLYQKNFQIITYLVPEHKKTKHDFNKISDLVFKFDNQINQDFDILFNRLFNYINKYYIVFISIYTIYLIIYTVYLQFGLNSLGIPFEFINSIQSFGVIILFILIVTVLILTLFIPVFAGLLYLIFDSGHPILLLFILIAFVLVHQFSIEKFYTWKKLTNFIKFQLFSLLEIFYKIIPSFILLIMLVVPFLYTFELVFSKNREYYFQPTLLIKIYKNFYGYPNIIEIKDRKYIFVGKDEILYQVYDLNKTVNYYLKNSNLTQKLCINLDRNISKMKSDDIALKLLLLSPYNNIDSDLEYLKINDTKITNRYEYNAKNIDLNMSILINNCKSTSKVDFD